MSISDKELLDQKKITYGSKKSMYNYRYREIGREKRQYTLSLYAIEDNFLVLGQETKYKSFWDRLLRRSSAEKKGAFTYKVLLEYHRGTDQVIYYFGAKDPDEAKIMMNRVGGAIVAEVFDLDIREVTARYRIDYGKNGQRIGIYSILNLERGMDRGYGGEEFKREDNPELYDNLVTTTDRFY